MTSSDIVSLFVTALNLLPIQIYFVTRSRQEPEMRFFAIMLIAHFVADLFGTIAWIHRDAATSLVFSNTYSIIETAMLILLFRVKLNQVKKPALLILGAVVIVIELYQMAIDPGIFSFPIFSRIVLSVSVTILSVLYFYKLLKDLPAVHIYKVPMFWINMGLVIYFMGNFVLFILKDYLANMLANDLRFYWGYHNFLAGLSYLLFSVGLLQAPSSRPVSNTHR